MNSHMDKSSTFLGTLLKVLGIYAIGHIIGSARGYAAGIVRASAETPQVQPDSAAIEATRPRVRVTSRPVGGILYIDKKIAGYIPAYPDIVVVSTPMAGTYSFFVIYPDGTKSVAKEVNIAIMGSDKIYGFEPAKS